MTQLAERLEVGRGAVPAVPAARDPAALALRRRPARRRARTGLAGYVVPSRLYGVLAVGRPVVVAADEDSETAQVVRAGRLRRRRAARPSGAARAGAPRGSLRRLDLEEMGRRGREYVTTEADRSVAVGRYRGLLRELTAAPPDRAQGLFWGSLAALAWTHVGYPAAAAWAARLRPRPVRQGDLLDVTVIVAAHDEEAVIERRLENLLALDYPTDRVEIVVASDASTDRTNDRRGSSPRASRASGCCDCPRGGKVAAQNLAVREAPGEVVAFSDANARGRPTRSAGCSSALADPEVAYVCGRLMLEDATGRTARASTGATSCGCASRRRPRARSRAATARSTH